MAIVHFLNVKDGDCSVIQHVNGRVTVIDVNNAKKPEPKTIERLLLDSWINKEIIVAEKGGNFQQKKKPVNPIEYLHDRGITDIFRFFLTHPDMDHMGGIKDFFGTFNPSNFWDTDNTKEMGSFKGSPYSEDDWKFYKNMRDNKPESNPRRLTGYSGRICKYINLNEAGKKVGDGIYILCPIPELVKEANDDNEYHKASYVIQYCPSGGTVIFGGDSHDDSWKYITDKDKDVANVALLIAPHHGRASGRSYDFLDVLKPKLTFFGNAQSQDLAYGAWRRRRLPYITNNQANCMIVEVGTKPMKVYVTNETFARACNPLTYFSEVYQGWFLQNII